MKFIFTFFLCLFFANVFAQNLAECGLDDNAQLTDNEAVFLNSYFNKEDIFDASGTKKLENFSFVGKKIIFVTNPSGNGIIGKKKYFYDIRCWDKNNDKIATYVTLLTEKEKIASGGYDAFVTDFVKVLLKSSRKKVIKEIAQKR
jgi:hypothetical protein